ncbi:hypothetical protein BDR07DRAFT_64009 [Suillus spraguei]|nr:hypothetical protein BDR07DRAFT_64009 [Suillus spraguei]
MSPVVLPKDYPTWCTERFSLFRSRSLDWEDCLWQLWLESAGEVKSTTVDNWPVVESGESNNSILSAKLRRRWTIKYRAEACALAIKRGQILEEQVMQTRRPSSGARNFVMSLWALPRQTLLD